MGHGKETPRQKMIGMMYLVLTAMLALNVSKDILNAFVLVDKGLAKTTANFVDKNRNSYAIFDAELEKTPEKVRPFHDEAFKVRDMADQLAYDIQELKAEIVRYCDGAKSASLIPVEWVVGKEMKPTHNIDASLINAKDNYDKPSEILILKKEGEKLRHKFDAFRDHLVSLTTEPSVQNAIKESLNTDPHVDLGGVESNWETTFFYHVPLVGVVAMLTKLQSDVRNAEADIIQYLLSQIGATDTKVNKMEAIVVTKSNYVLKGNNFEARILLAAYDSLQKPDILLGRHRRNADGTYEMVDGGTLLPYDEKGRAMLIRPGTSVGNFTVEGLLQMITAEGPRNYPFSTEYQVGVSSTVISPTKMNVMYIGVDNPIEILMSGVPSEKITATMTNGSITKSGNEWIAKPNSPGNARISVRGEVDKKQVDGGYMDFRIKMLPTPIAKIGGRPGGNIDKNVLVSSPGVGAELDDFLFDLRYQVTQFNVGILTPQGERVAESKSAAFTDAQKSLISGVTKGAKVFISNIKARGPAGVVDLNDITFTIN